MWKGVTVWMSLKVEPPGFDEGLDTGKKEREESRLILRVLA